MLSDQIDVVYRRRSRIFVLVLAATTTLCVVMQPRVLAQPSEGAVNVGERRDEISADGDGFAPLPATGEPATKAKFNLLDLLVKGGALMIPIGMMSIIVVALVFERFLNLRERKVLPKQLVSELGTLAASSSCLLYTSPSPRDQRGSRMPSSA